MEAQLGWIYVGHGEWVQVNNQVETVSHNNSLEIEPEWVRKWRSKEDPDIGRHLEVRNKGYPNRWGAQVQVKSTWNLRLMGDLLQKYEDKEVVEWLTYGWQVAYPQGP